jgi:hypothetical protein
MYLEFLSKWSALPVKIGLTTLEIGSQKFEVKGYFNLFELREKHLAC